MPTDPLFYLVLLTRAIARNRGSNLLASVRDLSCV
jgi:hypothetical protein